MKVGELKDLLKELPENLEVWISDGYEGNDYHGNFLVNVLDGVDGHKYVEIEIGGNRLNRWIANQLNG